MPDQADHTPFGSTGQRGSQGDLIPEGFGLPQRTVTAAFKPRDHVFLGYYSEDMTIGCKIRKSGFSNLVLAWRKK